MFKRLCKSLPVIIIACLLLLFLLWQAFVFLRPRPPDIPLESLVLLEVAAEDAARAITPLFAGKTAQARIGLAHLNNDPYATVTTMLGEAIDARSELVWDRSPVVRRVIKDISSATWNAGSFEELAASGRKVQLEGIVSGRVIVPPDGALPRLELSVFDLQPGGVRHQLTFTGHVRTTIKSDTDAKSHSDAAPDAGVVGINYGWLALALLAILALPWLTPFLTEWTISRKSNSVSAILLIGYVALDLLALVMVPGVRGALNGTVLWPIVAAALCAGYSHWACEQIAKKIR